VVKLNKVIELAQNLYLVWGSDAFLIKNATEKILENNNIDKPDVEFYDLEETSLTEALEHAMTIPFFVDKKAVLLANACFLGGLKPQKDVVHPLEQLEAYLIDPNPTTVMIIQAPYEKLDRSLKVFKLLTQRAEVIDCSPDNNADVFQEVKDALEKEQMRIDANALQMFVGRIGPNRLLLESELNKLIAYAYGSTTITAEMIKEIVYRNPDDHIYLLVNAVIAMDTQMLMQIYKELLSANVDEMWIIKAICSKFQEILYTKELLKQNFKQEDIMKYFQVNKGRAYYIMKNAREVADDRLLFYLDQLDGLDTKIKTGQIDKEVGLELFLLELYTQ
jgi:DNA polymerase-3 subunit delta